MPPPLTAEERGVPEWARIVDWPGFENPNRGTDARETPARDASGDLQQQPPYSGRQGPLMKMLAAVERERSRPERAAREKARAAELEAKERERDLLLKRLPSLAGGARARFLHSEHQQKTKTDKTYGIGWGVEWLNAYAKGMSGWDKKHNTQELQDLYWRYYNEKKADLEARGLEEVSCLTMMEKSLPGYVRALSEVALSKEKQLGLEEALSKARAKARDARAEGEVGAKGSKAVEGGRATVLLEELRKRFGFETVYIDAEPKEGYETAKGYKSKELYTSFKRARATGKVPAVKASEATVIGADTHTEIDARVNLDRFVDVAKLTPSSRALWEELSRVEFAVGVADSGYHTFVVSGGMVYEIHWNKGPDDPLLTSSKSLESFFKVHTTGTRGEWGSGVLAVPPGVLTRDKPAPEKKPKKRRQTR
jgi:hypothetical protein